MRTFREKENDQHRRVAWPHPTWTAKAPVTHGMFVPNVCSLYVHASTCGQVSDICTYIHKYIRIHIDTYTQTYSQRHAHTHRHIHQHIHQPTTTTNNQPTTTTTTTTNNNNNNRKPQRLPPRGVCRLFLGGFLVKSYKTSIFVVFVNKMMFRALFLIVFCSFFWVRFLRKGRQYHAFRLRFLLIFRGIF